MAGDDQARHLTPEPAVPVREILDLDDDERALLRRWIAEGAPWPDGVTLAPPADDGKPARGRRTRRASPTSRHDLAPT